MVGKSPFARWLEQSYLEWMRDQGQYRKQKEFAAWLEIPQATLNRYINATRTPVDPDHIQKIANKLGMKAYDLLGLLRPDEDIEYIISHWDDLTKSEKSEIRILVARYSEKD